MILKQGHTYRAMPHDGKLIAYIYRGGRCYYHDGPYSLAATQALKAAFPQYWTAIRDYGWANPQLVPFINEDPMLIVSLVEVGKTRTLDGDGFAYINTNFKPTQGIPFEIVYHSYFVKNSTRQIEGWNASQWWGINGNGSSFGQNGSGSAFVEGELNEIVISYSGTGSTPISLNRNRAGNPGFVSTDFHAFHINGWNNECMRDRRCDIKIAEGTTPIREMYPFIRNGEAGMLDILSGTFHPNANTEGAFTIQITDKA